MHPRLATINLQHFKARSDLEDLVSYGAQSTIQVEHAIICVFVRSQKDSGISDLRRISKSLQWYGVYGFSPRFWRHGYRFVD